MAGIMKGQAYAVAGMLVAGMLAVTSLAAATVDLTDMTGRVVRVPAAVRRIVPLGGALRYVTYLGALDQVVGVERIERSWQSAGRLYGLATAELARRLPVVGEGGPGRLPDFEKLVELWPDVVVVMGMPPAQVETIARKTGIPVLALTYGSSETLDVAAACTAMRLLGDVLGRQQRAGELVEYVQGLIANLAARTDNDADRLAAPDVYVGGISYKGVQAITSTEAFHAPLAWVRGRNLADRLGRAGHFFIDPEQLLEWNPALIFIDAASLPLVAADYRQNPQFYRHLRAFQEQRVYLTLPHNYYHANLEIALADAYCMGKTLYPQQFLDIDPAAQADEIFTFFIGQAAYARLCEEYHGFQQLDCGSEQLRVRRRE